MQLFRDKKLTNLLRFMLRVDGSSLKMQLFRDKKLTNLLRFMLRVVGASLKMVKFFSQHFWMLHDVVLVWSRSCFVRAALLCRSIRTRSVCVIPHVVKYCNRVAKRVQHVVHNNVALKCCDCLAGA